MSSFIVASDFKAGSTVKLLIGTQEIASYVVPLSGNFSRQVPYDNGEVVKLVGINKQNLPYERTYTVSDLHQSDKPANIIIHDDVHTVTGTAEANSVIRITDSNGNVVGIATSDYLGKFTVTTAPFTGGEQLNIVATDKDGYVSAPAVVTVPQPVATTALLATSESLDHLLVDSSTQQTSETTHKSVNAKHQIDLDQIIADAAKEHSVAFEKNIPNEATSKHQVDNNTDLHTLPIKAQHFEELAQTPHLF